MHWEDFLNKNFGYEKPQSYAVDFAPLFETSALENSRLVWHEGRIVASATLYPVTVVTPQRDFRLGIVGAVATAPEFRGRGISSHVLGELEQAGRAAGLNGLVLWSDKDDFYAKAGYTRVGRQLIYPLAGLAAPRSLTEGTPIYGWDWPQVRELYAGHPLRVARTNDHWQGLERIRSCTRVQWVHNDGHVLAYLGFDRGRDLHGIVHEWGGNREALHCLVWTVLQSRPELLWLTHPALQDTIRPLLPQPPLVDSHLALFKPLTPALSASDLDDAWFWGLDSL